MFAIAYGNCVLLLQPLLSPLRLASAGFHCIAQCNWFYLQVLQNTTLQASTALDFGYSVVSVLPSKLTCAQVGFH